jgi:hypothetical protein
MRNIEEIRDNDQLLAFIIRANHIATGVEFYTPNEFSQQLAAMGHPKGKIIPPHVHNSVTRKVEFTKEVLIIKNGKLRVDFYREDQTYINSTILNKDDVILLARGGHGFEVLEDLQMIEVKQGPYAGEKDKIRFEPISQTSIRMRKT